MDETPTPVTNISLNDYLKGKTEGWAKQIVTGTKGGVISAAVEKVQYDYRKGVLLPAEVIPVNLDAVVATRQRLVDEIVSIDILLADAQKKIDALPSLKEPVAEIKK